MNSYTLSPAYAAPGIHREYALKDTGTDYILNMDGIKSALLRYEKSGLPVRFMGFPAYFMFLLKELIDSGIKLKLHPKSLILLAGGWKNFFTEEVAPHDGEYPLRRYTKIVTIDEFF